MRRLFCIASLSLASASAAAAVDTVSCTDPHGEITFSYTIDGSLPQPLIGVEMQLADDFGFSTEPGHPKHDGEYVSDGFKLDDMEGGDVSWDENDGDPHLAMSFRIGRAYHGAFHVIGGVVSVGGGGVWVVECRSSAYGESGT